MSTEGLCEDAALAVSRASSLANTETGQILILFKGSKTVINFSTEATPGNQYLSLHVDEPELQPTADKSMAPQLSEVNAKPSKCELAKLLQNAANAMLAGGAEPSSKLLCPSKTSLEFVYRPRASKPAATICAENETDADHEDGSCHLMDGEATSLSDENEVATVSGG
jgi:hypothetical protein